MRKFLERKFFKEPPEIKPIVEQVVPGVVYIGLDIPPPGRISRILEFLAKCREFLAKHWANLIVSIFAGFIVALILYFFNLG
ncbi:MAG: hypothetical protein F4Y78_06165 [Candidatus Dadabacteria bacterium]|nr:hypothetical protein [Candidatus Dadabacteria bacterium]MYA48293.1 hypothetical protein [Candidatus Dadabacteria bacterium]MYK48975.1 hypothetical protein [Candidatus Dadabacteria bacterium]